MARPHLGGQVSAPHGKRIGLLVWLGTRTEPVEIVRFGATFIFNFNHNIFMLKPQKTLLEPLLLDARLLKLTIFWQQRKSRTAK